MEINQNKNYSVSGKVLDIIRDIEHLYNVPNLVIEGQMCIDGNNCTIKSIPLDNDKLHYLVGQLIATYNSKEWEEV